VKGGEVVTHTFWEKVTPLAFAHPIDGSGGVLFSGCPFVCACVQGVLRPACPLFLVVHYLLACVSFSIGHRYFINHSNKQ